MVVSYYTYYTRWMSRRKQEADENPYCRLDYLVREICENRDDIFMDCDKFKQTVLRDDTKIIVHGLTYIEAEISLHIMAVPDNRTEKQHQNLYDYWNIGE